MRVPLSWLREMCPVDQSAEDLAELLHLRGLHIEAIERPWEGLSGIVVARVLEVADHPNADTLCLARVDVGGREFGLVVGVRNMAPGDLVPLAPPGARIPEVPGPISARELRGEVSEGMLCSARELRVSADHTAILILPADTPLGADVKSQLGLDDVVLDVEVEPNRPDLMSVMGVAREASAATGVPFSLPDTTVTENGEKAEEVASVEVLDVEGCPRYVGRVIRGVDVGPAPIQVQARLTAAGMRPVSNVVDATNYALLEMGQPMHPFDLSGLGGATIVVRRAKPGERMVTLDDVEREFSEEDLLIADREKAVGIAGIMGSEVAEVSKDTRDVVLESAYFQPRTVLRAARRLGLRTEASMRFERGVDPENVPRGADRAAGFMAEWAGGSVLAGAIDVGQAPSRRRVTVRPGRAGLVIGYDVSAADIQSALGRLLIPVELGDDGEVVAEIPGYRVDLEREVDLIEEVARVRGYDTVPSTLPAIRQAGGLAPVHAFRRRIREALVRAGLREVRSLAFVSAGDLAMMRDRQDQAVRVSNPLVADDAFLRTSLLPGLLRALGRNLSRQVRGAALFEVGVVFRADDPVREREWVALAMTGPTPASWAEPGRDGDFFDAKGAVEDLLDSLGITGLAMGEALPAPFHPTRSADVLVGGEPIGVVGELHPREGERLDFPGRVAVAEIDATELLGLARGGVVSHDIPRFPPVHRDLAFIVDAATPAEAVRTALVDAAGGLVGSVRLFDLHVGDPVPAGKKSLAFAVNFRAPDRTLTDDEVDRAVAAMVDGLKRDFGGELRSG
jgi:phenylalanyl-tRNA synthetase beta chain